MPRWQRGALLAGALLLLAPCAAAGDFTAYTVNGHELRLECSDGVQARTPAGLALVPGQSMTGPGEAATVGAGVS